MLAVRRAAEVLRSGGLVAFPTETVYGLGAAATDDHAVARIFEAKGRPRFNPLIVHVADKAAAAAIADWTDLADRLAARFWPGPLTLILRRRSQNGISKLVSAGGETIALRAPAHPLARALLVENRPSDRSAKRQSRKQDQPDHRRPCSSRLGDRVDLILDGGACLDRRGVDRYRRDRRSPCAAAARRSGAPRYRDRHRRDARKAPRPAAIWKSRPLSPGTIGKPLRPSPSPPPERKARGRRRSAFGLWRRAARRSVGHRQSQRNRRPDRSRRQSVFHAAPSRSARRRRHRRHANSLDRPWRSHLRSSEASIHTMKNLGFNNRPHGDIVQPVHAIRRRSGRDKALLSPRISRSTRPNLAPWP